MKYGSDENIPFPIVHTSLLKITGRVFGIICNRRRVKIINIINLFTVKFQYSTCPIVVMTKFCIEGAKTC